LTINSVKVFLLLLFSVLAALVIGMGAAGLLRFISHITQLPITRDIIVGISCTLAGIFLGALYQKYVPSKKKF